MADELQKGARLLEEMVEPDHPVWDKADEIKEVEHKCDFLTHEIIQRLNRTFVTPIDREDIHELARSLDDVMDAIDACAAVIRLYRLNAVRFGARELARVVSASTVEIRKAIAALERRQEPRDARRRNQSPRERSRPPASAGRRPPLRRGNQSHRRDEVERDAGLSRAGDRPLRGRRQRHRRRRRQTRLADALLDRRRPRPRRADLRLHQRISRRREFDRDDCLHARPVAREGRGLGRVLQLRRRIRVRHRRGADDRQRDGRHHDRDAHRHLCRADRRDHVESADVVARPCRRARRTRSSAAMPARRWRKAASPR